MRRGDVGLFVALLLAGAAGESRAFGQEVPRQVRDDILKRAQVWSPRVTPTVPGDMGRNPDGPKSLADDATVDCRFKPAGVGGSTPKFECELPDGEDVKVKYGRGNPEVFSEVIASRLLAALGFPADRMYVVERVRCYGCPPEPFKALQCLNDGTPKTTCFPDIDYKRSVVFEDAVIERPVEGRRIELHRDRGWRWDELSRIDPTAGGAPREHVDALRLLAVFLGHWDNKSKNQRLLCLGTPKPKEDDRATLAPALADSVTCEHPLAMVQDLGDAFGPFKLDLEGWRKLPVWSDAAGCRVSMRSLPYGGSTFKDVSITEAGRAFLAERLRSLTTADIRALLAGAQLDRYRPAQGHVASLDEWTEVFTTKIKTITDRPPCPTAAAPVRRAAATQPAR